MKIADYGCPPVIDVVQQYLRARISLLHNLAGSIEESSPIAGGMLSESIGSAVVLARYVPYVERAEQVDYLKAPVAVLLQCFVDAVELPSDLLNH